MAFPVQILVLLRKLFSLEKEEGIGVEWRMPAELEMQAVSVG